MMSGYNVTVACYNVMISAYNIKIEMSWCVVIMPWWLVNNVWCIVYNITWLWCHRTPGRRGRGRPPSSGAQCRWCGAGAPLRRMVALDHTGIVVWLFVARHSEMYRIYLIGKDISRKSNFAGWENIPNIQNSSWPGLGRTEHKSALWPSICWRTVALDNAGTRGTSALGHAGHVQQYSQ